MLVEPFGFAGTGSRANGIMPAGIAVSTLLEAVDGEGSIQAASEAYEVDESDIKLALRYDDVLSGIAA